jgi:hypothetical protein
VVCKAHVQTGNLDQYQPSQIRQHTIELGFHAAGKRDDTSQRHTRQIYHQLRAFCLGPKIESARPDVNDAMHCISTHLHASPYCMLMVTKLLYILLSAASKLHITRPPGSPLARHPNIAAASTPSPEPCSVQCMCSSLFAQPYVASRLLPNKFHCFDIPHLHTYRGGPCRKF